MKKKKLNEEGFEKMSGFRAVGGSTGQWTHDGGVKGYTRQERRTKADMEKDDVSKIDPHIEQQLIDRAIDLLFSEHPDLIQHKKIRRHHLQMLIGRVTTGEINDLITLKNMIKSLKRRGVTVESSTMKVKKEDIKQIIREVIKEQSLNEKFTETDTKITQLRGMGGFPNAKTIKYWHEKLGTIDPKLAKEFKSVAISLAKINKAIDALQSNF